MKVFLSMAVASIVLLAACNNSNDSGSGSGKEAGKAPRDSGATASNTASAVPGASANPAIKPIIAGYLQLKSSLADDDGDRAADAGRGMVEAFGKFDKSALTPEQKKAYESVEDDAREHAEHIGKSGGNIKHQREHFELLSQDVYRLVKTLGPGQPLYFDHCPMYNDNKGADWLSEVEEIKNPYLGKEMATCGTVKEVLK